jgi:MinD superfamily P-loop ATPase
MKVAIASGKGGTGKTTLAVNLALRTAETMDVSLLDLDVEEPNSGIFIQGEQIECQNMYRKVPIWKREFLYFMRKNVLIYASLTLF